MHGRVGTKLPHTRGTAGPKPNNVSDVGAFVFRKRFLALSLA